MSDSDEALSLATDAAAWHLIDTWTSVVEMGRVQTFPLAGLIQEAIDSNDEFRLVTALTVHGTTLIQRIARAEGKDILQVLTELRETATLARLDIEVDSDDQS